MFELRGFHGCLSKVGRCSIGSLMIASENVPLKGGTSCQEAFEEDECRVDPSLSSQSHAELSSISYQFMQVLQL